MDVGKRYEIIKRNEIVVWYNDKLKKWPLLLSEVEEAAKEVFSGARRRDLILFPDSVGVIMKIKKFKGDEKIIDKERYDIQLSNNSNETCIVWHNEDVWGQNITLYELQQAAHKLFPKKWHKRIVLKRHECGIVMRLEYESLKRKLNEK